MKVDKGDFEQMVLQKVNKVDFENQVDSIVTLNK